MERECDARRGAGGIRPAVVDTAADSHLAAEGSHRSCQNLISLVSKERVQ